MVRKTDGEIRRLEANLVQGRWNTVLMPKVVGFDGLDISVWNELPSSDAEGESSFTAKQPGLGLTIDSIDSLSDSDTGRIFGQVGALMSVAIFEKRFDAIEIESKTLQKQFRTQDEIDRRKTTYLGKPYETFCQENVSFILKHLNETVFQSGISTLYKSEAMHDTYYKHAQMLLENEISPSGGEQLKLKFQMAYVSKERTTNETSMTFQRMLKTTKDRLVHCINCDSSKIKLAKPDGSLETLYSMADQKTPVLLSDIWSG